MQRNPGIAQLGPPSARPGIYHCLVMEEIFVLVSRYRAVIKSVGYVLSGTSSSQNFLFPNFLAYV